MDKGGGGYLMVVTGFDPDCWREGLQSVSVPHTYYKVIFNNSKYYYHSPLLLTCP